MEQLCNNSLYGFAVFTLLITVFISVYFDFQCASHVGAKNIHDSAFDTAPKALMSRDSVVATVAN